MNDFIDRTENHWRNRGLSYSPENAVHNFQLYGPRKRAEALDQLDTELRNIEEISDNVSAIRRAAEMVELRQTLDDVHHNLLKVNR
jgi:hypothetical protein